MLKVFAVETPRETRHEAVRTVLRWKYEEIWNTTMPELVLTPEGKPRFAADPAYLSISHTDGVSFCALADGEIGLDVEKLRSVSPNTAAGVLSRDEWMQYSAAKNPAEAFLKFWTLKEAYCKFTGLGISGYRLKDLSFDLTGGRIRLLSEPGLYFWSKTVGDIVISLCADYPHRPELHRMEL